MVRGKTRSINRPNLDYDIQTKIHNRFDVEVIDTRTGKVRQSCRGHNVICDQLWEKWFLQYAWNSYIFYGSGEGTPTSSDTKLFNRIGYAQSSHHAVDSNSDEHWVSYTRKIQISESTAVGEKITEVGIGYSSSETSLCTHAMLQDMNGNTISIEKTDTDVINIYATVFVHWTPTNAVKIFGYWKDTPANAGFAAFAGIIQPSGDASTPLYSGNAFVTKGILSRDFDPQYPTGYIGFSTSIDRTTRRFTITFNRFTVAQYNTSGLHHIVLYYQATYTKGSYWDYYLRKPWASIEFPSDQVPAVRVIGEAVGTGDGVTTEFVTKFPHAQNATVYVDGVVATGVTVNPNTFAPGYNIGDYFEEVWVSGSGGNAGFSGLSKEGFNSNELASYHDAKNGEYYILYNPNYEVGIKSLYVCQNDVYVSNDLLNWERVWKYPGDNALYTLNVTSEFTNYKYWKIVNNSGSKQSTVSNATVPDDYNSNNIIFDTPPAEGSVITIDYTPQCIPKDENHVFDLSVTFSFGEYSDT